MSIVGYIEEMQPQNILANRKRPKTSCMIRNTYSLLVRGVGKSPIDDIFSPQKKTRKIIQIQMTTIMVKLTDCGQSQY